MKTDSSSSSNDKAIPTVTSSELGNVPLNKEPAPMEETKSSEPREGDLPSDPSENSEAFACLSTKDKISDEDSGLKTETETEQTAPKEAENADKNLLKESESSPLNEGVEGGSKLDSSAILESCDLNIDLKKDGFTNDTEDKSLLSSSESSSQSMTIDNSEVLDDKSLSQGKANTLSQDEEAKGHPIAHLSNENFSPNGEKLRESHESGSLQEEATPGRTSPPALIESVSETCSPATTSVEREIGSQGAESSTLSESSQNNCLRHEANEALKSSDHESLPTSNIGRDIDPALTDCMKEIEENVSKQAIETTEANKLGLNINASEKSNPLESETQSSPPNKRMRLTDESKSDPDEKNDSVSLSAENKLALTNVVSSSGIQAEDKNIEICQPISPVRPVTPDRIQLAIEDVRSESPSKNFDEGADKTVELNLLKSVESNVHVFRSQEIETDMMKLQSSESSTKESNVDKVLSPSNISINGTEEPMDVVHDDANYVSSDKDSLLKEYTTESLKNNELASQEGTSEINQAQIGISESQINDISVAETSNTNEGIIAKDSSVPSGNKDNVSGGTFDQLSVATKTEVHVESDDKTDTDRASGCEVNVGDTEETERIHGKKCSLSNKIVSGDSEDKVTATSENNSASAEEDQSSAVNDMEETSEKLPLQSEGDEEVCIVPDTEPRVVTDEEKAEAFEKVSKSTGVARGSPLKSNESCKDATASDHGKEVEINKTIGTTDSDTKKDENLQPDQEGSDTKNPDSGKRKFSIHLKSTSSLVAKEDSATNEEMRDNKQLSEGQDDIQDEERDVHTCANCSKVTKCKYKLKNEDGVYLCEDECYSHYRKAHEPSPASSAPTATIRARKMDHKYMHKCGQCSKKVDVNSEKALTWETMDFCSDECLEKYQKELGSCCANCKGPVQSASLGKYCVRFGHDMKQFCRAPCLEDFKKGLKVCSYCQKDISSGAEGFLAPVGDKGQFKDFCTQECMEKYDQMSNNSAPPEVNHECAVCNNVKIVKVQVLVDSKIQKLCSEPCFAAFKFVNAIVADQCDMCKKYFDRDRTENFTVFYDDSPHSFCCKTCMNVYILAKRKIVPCTWCKVKKYNFDMIKKTKSNGQCLMMCSLHCFNLYQVSSSAVNATSKHIKCDYCGSSSPAQYHLTMSDATLRSFCAYSCVMSFQAKFSKSSMSVSGTDKSPHPLGLPRKIAPKRPALVSISSIEKETDSTASSMPVISSVTSLAPVNNLLPSSSPSPTSPSTLPGTSKGSTTEPVKTVYKQQFIIRPPLHPEMSNCAVQVKPMSCTKAVSCRPHTCSVETQTEDTVPKPVLIPVPVPIYIPTPMHMYSSPYPIPVPIVLPIPVPIFIPTTRNSAKGIFKEIKRIQEKIPSDPYEAELLMMAEMVAGEKKKAENTDTESEDEDTGAAADDANETEIAAEPDFSTENDTGNAFGDDVLQIALKMASELDEPPVDFEATVTPSAITQATPTVTPQSVEPNDDSEGDDDESDRKNRSGRKRALRATAISPSAGSKRSRKSSISDHTVVTSTTDSPVCIKTEPIDKPDANMCLKFTFGVNAWKSWVNQKNADLEKTANASRKVKLFKTDLLQLTSDELNYSLCLFVKEVRKPNGTEYAPDTIYYLCLGIQQYLIENGRIENIFSDPYYEKFTDCLDEVAQQFSNLYSDSQFLVTRIEEEHLWESKQLGAHSPYVLLSTLMFFNTKYFNLTTVDEHMQLSFSHIMKHWKRNPNMPINAKTPGSRNVLLRFYPPQSALAANSKKKKVYEQQENEENPLRCPVKLYEFYLSKCPESVKTRNDVFYLLPERSCVPDSPVWYSTMALGHEQLQKMLHRIKMVKEIVMI